MNGINKYVTETSEEVPIDNVQLFISTGRPVAKAKPRPKSVVNLSFNVLIRERKWIDIDPQPFDRSCFEVSKFMTRTLQHDSSILRDEDGPVRFDDLIKKFKEKFAGTLQWTVKTWATSLAKGGGEKEGFQCCLNPYSSNEFLYFRAIQGHSGEKSLIHCCKTLYCYRMTSPSTFYHIGNAFDMHSIIKSGLIPGGKSLRRDRQSVFLTALDPMDTEHDRREVEHDLSKLRITPYKHTWRAHHKTVYWCNVKLAQRKGVQFYAGREDRLCFE